MKPWQTVLPARWLQAKNRLAGHSRAFWEQRTQREQHLLQLALLLLALSLLWLVAIKPALTTLAQAQRTLPTLRAQAAEVNALIMETRALKQQRQGVLSPDEADAALQASLRNTGLGGVIDLVRHPPGNASETRWTLTVTQAQAARLLDWLGRLPAVAQIRITQLELARSTAEGREQPGYLSGRIDLLLESGRAP